MDRGQYWISPPRDSSPGQTLSRQQIPRRAGTVSMTTFGRGSGKLPSRNRPPTQHPPFFDAAYEMFNKSLIHDLTSSIQNPSLTPRRTSHGRRMENLDATVVGSHESGAGICEAKGNFGHDVFMAEIPSSPHPLTCTEDGDCHSTTGSSCCSSCPDGMLCDAPDCAEIRIEVIPCAEEACEQPVCPEPCLISALQNLPENKTKSVILGTSRVSTWVDTVWGANEHQDLLQNVPSCKIAAYAGSSSLESANQKLGQPRDDVTHSVNPSYPSNETFQVSQFGFQRKQIPYAATRMDPPQGQDDFGVYINEYSYCTNPDLDILNDYASFDCPWDGCAEPFTSTQQWFPHLHKDHVDPQMTFGCPLQSEACPPAIGSNPLAHLEVDHGFTFDMNSGGLSCPAPACTPGELYCNPAMLHNHFDQAHATLSQGPLRCQLNTCNTLFEAPQKLFAHINEYHRIPDIAAPHEDDDLNRHAKRPKLASSSLTLSSPAPGKTHICKWQIHPGYSCNRIMESEEALQDHVSITHLVHTGKGTNFACEWKGCPRLEKRGDKRGFAQKGKLERHMATHTGYKCCSCNECGELFSAPQALGQHKLLHTGEKPWACKYCPKTFPQQSACTIHMRTHTNEKPLTCPICNKTFSESSNLAKHRKTHGEKGAHVCKVPGCGKGFVRMDQLKRHGLVHEKKAMKEMKIEKAKG